METQKSRCPACSDRSSWKSHRSEDRSFEKLGITNNAGVMQKTAILGTGRILKKGFEM